jgi:methylmalonyl-CoA decarboxylase
VAEVQVHDNGHVRHLTLSDSQRRNALSAVLLRGLVEALEDAARDGIRVVVLTMNPVEGVWSAGHDITELPTGDRDPLVWDNPLEEALRAIRDAPFPVIAAVDGSVWGGACDLVITCDLIVATSASQFAITPARLGIPYNTEGVAHFLSALPVHVVKEMFFTGDPIDAGRAAELGIVNRLAADRDHMASDAEALAMRIAYLAPLAIRAIKGEISTLSGARHLTSDEFERLNNARTRAWSSQDYREGLAAFHERRPAKFSGE